MEALLGRGFQPNTLKGYKTSVAHLTEEYLIKDYRAKDIVEMSTMPLSRAIEKTRREGGHLFLCTGKPTKNNAISSFNVSILIY